MAEHQRRVELQLAVRDRQHWLVHGGGRDSLSMCTFVQSQQAVGKQVTTVKPSQI